MIAYRLPTDFIKTLRSYMAEPHGWTPEQFNSVGIPQQYAIWGEHEGGPRYVSAAEQLAMINADRARAGLPPIPPRQRR